MAELKSIRLNKVELKLADTDDPVAQKLDWNPLHSGGSSFKTRDLLISPGLVEVKNARGFLLFAGFFFGMCLIALALSAYLLFTENWKAAIFPAAFGTVLALICSFVFREEKLSFNKHIGFYYRGKSYQSSLSGDREFQGRLSDIYAIQVISERLQSSSKSGRSEFTSYEINLVFKDGYRINVMDHGNAGSIEQSAKALGDFLDKPVWLASY